MKKTIGTIGLLSAIALSGCGGGGGGGAAAPAGNAPANPNPTPSPISNVNVTLNTTAHADHQTGAYISNNGKIAYHSKLGNAETFIIAENGVKTPLTNAWTSGAKGGLTNDFSHAAYENFSGALSEVYATSTAPGSITTKVPRALGFQNLFGDICKDNAGNVKVAYETTSATNPTSTTVMVFDVNNGTSSKLAGSEAFSISRNPTMMDDCSLIAYEVQSAANQNSEIVRQALDGSNSVKVSSPVSGTHIFNPQFDGFGGLLYSVGNNFLVGAGVSNPRVIPTSHNPATFSVSEDGSKIAYATNGNAFVRSTTDNTGTNYSGLGSVSNVKFNGNDLSVETFLNGQRDVLNISNGSTTASNLENLINN